jgi:hypothetical protein
MRLKGVLLFLLGVSVSYGLLAQQANDLTQSRILILLDGSSSMTQPWQSGKKKFRAASDIILKLMDSVYAVNRDVEFSLRVFGHQYTVDENNCYDTRTEVPFKKDNRLQMEYRLGDIRPLGVTSIAYSLKQAALNDLTDLEHNVYSIVLITDGGESCGGNICEIMQMLISKKVYFKPYIVSLEDYPELKKEYDCMGEYLQVTRDGEIPKAVGIIVDAFRPALKLTQTEYKELQTIAAMAPSIMKVNVPVIKEPTAPATETKAAPPAWMKPALEKIDNLAVRTRAIDIKVPAQQVMKLVTVPGMPDVAPEPVAATPESISRLTPAGLFKLNSSITSISRLRPVTVPEMPEIAPEPVKPAADIIDHLGWSKATTMNTPATSTMRLKTVQVPEMPEIAPEPVKPAPENIARIDIVRSRSINIPETRMATPTAVNYVIEMPEIALEPVRPAPERIGRMDVAKLHKFDSSAVTIAWLRKVDVPGMPEIAPEPVKPAPESITGIPLAKLYTFNTSIASIARLRTVQVPDMPEIAPEPVKPTAEQIIGITLAKPVTITSSIRAISRLKAVQVPDMPEIAPEPVKPAAESIDRIGLSKLSTLSTATPTVAKLKAVRVPDMPEIVPEFTKPAEERISGLTPARLSTVEVSAPVVSRMKTINQVIPMPELVIENPPPPPSPPIARLQMAALKRVNIIWVFDDRKLAPRAVPPMPALKIEEPPKPAVLVAKPTTPAKPGTKLPATQPEPPAKKMDVTVTVEDAQETSLQIYFTNGKGVYYQSTPQMLMLDQKTQAIAKKFYRTIDASGNPDPQTDLTPGTYDITFSAKRSLVAFNVKIEANKKNSITIKVPNPQLSFVYAEPNNFTKVSNRPVKEFVAVVIERNKVQGRVQQQKCTEVLEYEPGNYHIKLNTFPEDMRNLDLEFEEKIITIAQPGFAKFTNNIGARTAGLFTRVGDKFLQFYTLDLNRPDAQHLQMQPGEYQVHYQKGPGGAMTEKVKSFIVKSVQDTEVILE